MRPGSISVGLILRVVAPRAALDLLPDGAGQIITLQSNELPRLVEYPHGQLEKAKPLAD